MQGLGKENAFPFEMDTGSYIYLQRPSVFERCLKNSLTVLTLMQGVSPARMHKMLHEEGMCYT